MRAVILIAACLISSCARPNYVPSWPNPFASAGPQPGFFVKWVVDKQKPATLVAEDGSVCRTSVQRFAGTAVGKWIACNWALPDPDWGELARGGL